MYTNVRAADIVYRYFPFAVSMHPIQDLARETFYPAVLWTSTIWMDCTAGRLGGSVKDSTVFTDVPSYEYPVKVGDLQWVRIPIGRPAGSKQVADGSRKVSNAAQIRSIRVKYPLERPSSRDSRKPTQLRHCSESAAKRASRAIRDIAWNATRSTRDRDAPLRRFCTRLRAWQLVASTVAEDPGT